MRTRVYVLASAALACAGALVLLASNRDAQFAGGPRLVPTPPSDLAQTIPANGEFRGRIGPVALTDPPQPVPDLQFTDGQGQDVSLAAFHGRALVVNLWATWCVPCVEELPALDRLQAKLGGPGFEVVALSVDREGRSVVDPFLDKLAIKSLVHYHDGGNVATRTFKARGLPTTLLIDAEGREIGRLEGAAAWDSEAAEKFLRSKLMGGAG